MTKYLNHFQLDADAETHQLLNGLTKFSLNTIGDAFQSKLKDLEFGGISKIQIHLTQDINQDNLQKTFIDTKLIHRHLPFSIMAQSSEEDNVLLICDIIFDSLTNDANFNQENIGKLTSLKQDAVKTIFNFEGWLTSAKTNQSKDKKARAYFKYSKNIEVGVYIYKKNQDEQKVILFYYPPSLRSLQKLIAELSWENNDTLIVKRKDTNDFWRVDTRSNHADFIFSRAQENNPHGMYDLGLMYLEGDLVIANREKAITLLEKSYQLGYKKAEKTLTTLKA